MPKPTTVDFQGKNVTGQLMSFKPKTELWNEYELENGGTVRVRVLVSDIVVTDEKNAAGDPLVVVKAGMMVAYNTP